MKQRINKQEHPICPKCGYDQSGEVATWEDQCPIDGRCPECGYGFAWGDVLNPALIDLQWYVEHADSIGQMLRRTIPTLWMMLFPNRYWKRIRFETRRSLRRYVLWVGMLMLMAHIVSSAALVGASYGYMRQNNAYYTSWMNAAKTEQLRASFESSIVDTANFEYWGPIITEALFYPIINTSGNFQDFSSVIGALAATCLGIGLMWMIMFGLFPTTRARAQLRMVHLWRAVVVAGLLPFLIIELGRVIDALIVIGEYWPPMSGLAMPIVSVALVGLVLWLIIWTQWFWIAAVRVGWRVQARWYEMVLVTIASFLGLVFVGALMFLYDQLSTLVQWLVL